jgi:hypothetical protein
MSAGLPYRCTRICPSAKNISRAQKNHPATQIESHLKSRAARIHRTEIDERRHHLRARPVRKNLETTKCASSSGGFTTTRLNRDSLRLLDRLHRRLELIRNLYSVDLPNGRCSPDLPLFLSDMSNDRL